MGKYIYENLDRGERLIYVAKLHWIIFSWTSAMFFLSLILFDCETEIRMVSVWLFIVAIVMGLFEIQSRKTSAFILTNKRVFIKVGIFNVKTLETDLNKISAISVNQGFFGKFLGYGTLIIDSTSGIKETYSRIANVIEFQKRILEYIEP